MTKKKVEKKEEKKDVVEVAETESTDFSCLEAVRQIDQVVSYRLASESHRELGLALESAKVTLAQVKRWLTNANAVIEKQKLECPKL